jgi:hypothetical protein
MIGTCSTVTIEIME